MSRYKKAGVDIEGSAEVKNKIKELVESTYNENVVAGVGPFGAMYDLSKVIKQYKEPVLVSGIDGVGTKLIIAQEMNSLQGCGIDIINHDVNDILSEGAEPLYVKDYIAQDRLREGEILAIIEGMSLACKEAKIPLIGGETAQMPDVYRRGRCDVVGEITGIVEKDRVITGAKIKLGDVLLGLPSNGPHTNGYSLLRKIFFKEKHWSPYFHIDELGEQLGRALLKPHRSYLKAVAGLLLDGKEVSGAIHGIAHITGGGLPGNIVRILPEGCQAQIQLGSWPILPIFQYAQKEGNVSTKEMYQVFNMGIGMVLIVSQRTSEKICSTLWENAEFCYPIGKIVCGERKVSFYK